MSDEKVVIGLLENFGFELAAPPVSNASQLRLIGRVQKARNPSWLKTIEILDIAADTAAWTFDASRQHFVPKPLIQLVVSGSEPADGSHLRSAWRLIFQCGGLGGIGIHFTDIAEALRKVQQPRSELMEVPLQASSNRNQPIRGKGAQPTEMARVGPAAKSY